MGTIEEAMAEAVALSDETLIEPINDVLMINPEERLIEVPETELLLGVYTDRNVERKHFKCPRIVGDNIDLSLCYIFVNYVSSSGSPGQTQCNDVNVDETGNYITFSWLLSGNVFDKNIDSKVYFSVQAKMPSGENVFNTRKIYGNVYETIEAGKEITEEYADIILQIISRIDTIEQEGVSQEQINIAINKYFEANPINVPTKLSELSEDETHRTVTDTEKEQWNKAEENVQSDWNETDSTSDSYIKNKPIIPSKTSDLQNDSNFISSPMTAEVGQVLEVEAVDENGKPTAWKTVTLDDGIANVEMSSTDTDVTISPIPKVYIFPEMSELTITLETGKEKEMYHFSVISGATALVLTLNGITVATDSASIEASKTYEVDIWNQIAIVKAVA